MTSAEMGSIRAMIATITSGKTIRMPKTAMAIPPVMKRRRQTGVICFSTVAFTTALSNDSETSRIASTADDKHRRKGADQAASGLPAEQSPESEPGEGHKERVAKEADRSDHYPSRLAQSRAAVQSRPIATGAGDCYVGGCDEVLAKSTSS